MWTQLGMQASPSQIVAALERIGFEMSEEFVSRVKLQMLRGEAKTVQQQTKRPPKTKSRKRPQQRKIPKRR
jgi:hypothetical protein